MIKLSVIIPVYNQENLILKALDSIPERDDVETIVVDDCSTDYTVLNVMKWKMEHQNKKVEVLRNEKNYGVGYTVNRGLDKAKGEYIVLLGSDDYFYTAMFNVAMEELDGSDLIYFNLELNDGTIWELNNKTKYDYCGSTKFIRKEFLGYTRNPNMRAREDWYFYQNLMEKKPSEKFTNITAKHYNFPRKGSLTWEACNGGKK